MDRRDFLKLAGVSSAIPMASAQGEFFRPPSVPKRQFNDVDFLQSFDLDVVLIACGGAGIEMTKGIDKVAYGIRRIVALDTDKSVLRCAHHCDAVYWVCRKNGQEAKTSDEALEAAEERRAEIAELVGNHCLAIIVTGLSGAAGLGLSHMAALCARWSCAITLAFATLPLAYECDDAAQIASAGKTLLNNAVHNLLTYDHRVVDRSLPAISRHSSTYDYAILGLRQYLWNTVGCLTRQGIVGIDFEDVRTVLCHKPDQASVEGLYSWPTSRLGWGIANGPERAHQAANMAMHHPLLEANQLKPYFGISVSIRAARKELKMKEINAVMNIIKVHSNTDAHIIFSADADDTLEDRLQVSVILVPEGA